MTIFTSPNQNWWEKPGELDVGEPGVAARAKVWFQGEVIVTRYGMLTGLKSEHMQTYKELHATVWPDVLKTIKKCNIQDYSIYLKQTGQNQYLLFGCFEYTGDDFDADMAKMTADPATQAWWRLCKPCQQPLEFAAEGEWWTNMEEVFHQD